MTEYSQASKPVFIYDGDCAFCSSSVRFFRKLSPKNSVNIEAFQFLNLPLFGLTSQQCLAEAKFVAKDGQISGGYMAFARLFELQTGWLKFVGKFLRLPIVRTVSAAVYKWVAKNRYRLPGGTPECALRKSS